MFFGSGLGSKLNPVLAGKILTPIPNPISGTHATWIGTDETVGTDPNNPIGLGGSQHSML